MTARHRPGPRGGNRWSRRRNIVSPHDTQNRAWARVSRATPCPVCGHDSWCGISSTGRCVICMRHESPFATANGGWMHRIDGRAAIAPPTCAAAPHRPTSEIAALAREHIRLGRERGDAFERLTDALGINQAVVAAFGAGLLRDDVLSFPMVDADRNIIGIRYRSVRGSKWSATGGREGLFVPAGCPHGGPILLPEGPTDTAILLELGFDVAGRPNCNGGVRLLRAIGRGCDVVVIADNDDAGMRGSETVANGMLPGSRSVRVISPPKEFKDVRAWINYGGATDLDVQTLIDSAPPRRATITWRLP